MENCTLILQHALKNKKIGNLFTCVVLKLSKIVTLYVQKKLYVKMKMGDVLKVRHTCTAIGEWLAVEKVDVERMDVEIIKLRL